MTYEEARAAWEKAFPRPVNDYNHPCVWKCFDGMHYVGSVGYGRPQNNEADGKGRSWEEAIADAARRGTGYKDETATTTGREG